MGNFPSADINSFLNFRDYLGLLALNGAPAARIHLPTRVRGPLYLAKFEPDNLASSSIRESRRLRFTAISTTLCKAI